MLFKTSIPTNTEFSKAEMEGKSLIHGKVIFHDREERVGLAASADTGILEAEGLRPG